MSFGTVGLIILILVGLGGAAAQWCFNKQNSIDRKEDIDQIEQFVEKGFSDVWQDLKANFVEKENLQEEIKIALQSFSVFDSNIDRKFPGFSLHLILQILKVNNSSRKFIYDLGYEDKNRLSIYLDSENNLCFRIIDTQNESQIIKIPQKLSFQWNKFFYLNCEFGNLDRKSFMKIYINGKLIHKLDIPYSIDHDKFKPENGFSIGADIKGENFGTFNLVEVIAYSLTLTSDEKQQLGQYFKEKPRKGWVAFNGSQFLKRDPK